jgi:DNA replication protein DnaC
MDAAQAKLAFQVISERYDYRRATCITTNRPFKDWTKVYPFTRSLADRGIALCGSILRVMTRIRCPLA